MNELEIETLLRKAPRFKSPQGLLATLSDDISLPQRTRAQAISPGWVTLWRRWLPATAYGVCILACSAAVLVQWVEMKRLREENKKMAEAIAGLSETRNGNSEDQALRTENLQLPRLEKDSLEANALRAEAIELRQQLRESNAVQAENRRLQLEKNSSGTGDDFFTRLAQAKDDATATSCVNNLKQVSLSARLTVNNDKTDFLAKDFASLTNEMSSPKLLICPSDPNRKVENVTWADVERGNVSYQIVTPGAAISKPYVIYLKCPFHNNIALVDGSVQRNPPATHISVDADGQLQMK